MSVNMIKVLYHHGTLIHLFEQLELFDGHAKEGKGFGAAFRAPVGPGFCPNGDSGGEAPGRKLMSFNVLRRQNSTLCLCARSILFS